MKLLDQVHDAILEKHYLIRTEPHILKVLQVLNPCYET